MAKLGEECRLHSVCLSKYFRLPVTFGQSIFLINVGRTAVSSIQVEDRKLLQTWTLKHPHSFTCPVVFNEAESTLCCVVNNNALMLWSYDAVDLEDATKLKLQESIFAIIPVEGQKPVVVFNKGGCYTLDYISANSNTSIVEFLNNDEDIIWAESAVEDSTVVIFYLTLVKTINEYKCHSFILSNTDHVATHLNTWTISRDSESLKGWCVRNGTNNVAFLTVWSDGEVHSYTPDGNDSKLFTIPNMKNSKFSAIDVIDEAHLAIVRLNSTKKEKNEAVLDIWDVKYAARKISKVLKTPLSPNLQMKILQSTIFLPSNEDIVTISVHVNASTLAAAVGKVVSISEVSKKVDYRWTSDGKLEMEPLKEPEANHFSFNLTSTKFSAQSFLKKIRPNTTKEEMKQLCDYLIQLKDIPELELVKVLKFVLNDWKKIFSSENKMEDENCFLSKKAMFLNAIFQVSYSDLFLREHLCYMSTKEVVATLKHLLFFFNQDIITIETEQRPTDLQLVNWIQLLIPLHSDKISFSKDKKILNLVKKLHRSISEKMDVYCELEQIEILLLLQKKKNIIPEKTIQGKYCIETLHL